jgi:putative OPT family oligopeptide transporter
MSSSITTESGVKEPGIVDVSSANPYQSPFKPYVPANVWIPELTLQSLIVGIVLGLVFGASSLYLVLKVGLTVSASISAAVISIAFFHLFPRRTTILENNITQSTASSGESLAFGLGITMPATLLLGFDLEPVSLWMVTGFGGLLGLLIVIMSRRALIVQQHGSLKFPEGTACAEVLKANDSDVPNGEAKSEISGKEGVGAKVVFTGFGIGFIYQTAMSVFKLWKPVPEKIFSSFKGGSIALESSPALLGVGYIIGPRVSSMLCAGSIFSHLVLIPLITFFGAYSVVPPAHSPVSELLPYEIRNNYILYIGAGAVAAGGIVSLFRALPTIWLSLKASLNDLRSNQPTVATLPRTDRDIPLKVVLVSILALAILMLLTLPHMNLLSMLLVLIFGFLFAIVAARITGEIGSSATPISGLTLATLLLTCLIFMSLGWTGTSYWMTVLAVIAIVCIAVSNGGTSAQVLKTGFLVGATPKSQQVAILIGTLTAMPILALILLQLNSSGTVYVPRNTFVKVAGVKNVGRIDPNLVSKKLTLYTKRNLPGEPSGEYYSLSYPASGEITVAGLETGEYLVDKKGEIAYFIKSNFSEELRTDVSQLKEEKLQGPQQESDKNTYYAWNRRSEVDGITFVKYLCDKSGTPVYLVDPGINGNVRKRPDGSMVTKYDAPKAAMFAYIIKGLFGRHLPFGLVLLGVALALVLEMAGVPSLVVAVGVYLPISTTSPILIGGIIRRLVDRALLKKYRRWQLTEDEIADQGDRSPGTLMASGYIAGAAIAGIIIAFMAAWLSETDSSLEKWSAAYNPFFGGFSADVLSLFPFILLSLLLYTVGREWWLVGRPMSPPKRR